MKTISVPKIADMRIYEETAPFMNNYYYCV